MPFSLRSLKPTYLFIVLLFSVVCGALIIPIPTLATTLAAHATLQVDHVEGNSIFLKPSEGTPNPAPLKTTLFDLKYLGFVQPNDGSLPYAVVAAKPCEHCTDEKAIFLVRLDNKKQAQFVYPGKIIDPKTGRAIMDSHAFFGNCLSEGGSGFSVFQKELIEKKKRKRRIKTVEASIFVADPAQDMIHERMIDLTRPKQLDARLRFALQRVRAKQCFEIEGRNRQMQSKPLDLRLKKAQEQEEEEDKDLENDTGQPNPPAASSPGAPGNPGTPGTL